jgi:glyoxylase-like metal-dependent hydrolase (beta-lactamase superfamily II)
MYVLSFESNCWAVDVGDADILDDYVSARGSLLGVFITHAHYDHIEGINRIAARYPRCVFYGSEYTLLGLRDAKLNLSFYHERPVVYEGTLDLEFPSQGVVLDDNGCRMFAIETPGHNAGALTYVCHPFVFTGDSFIPGIPVVTKLKSGDKASNRLSLAKIRSILDNDSVICPGHCHLISAKELTDADFPDL